MFRFVVFTALIAMCNAGVANYNGATVIAPTVTSEQQNVLRSYGNLQQVSYNSKTIDTPYSSVSKHDVRVSNPGIAISHQPIAYHSAPAVHHAAPVYQQSYHAPQVHSVPAYHAPQVHSVPAYHAAPAYHSAQTYQAPAVVASPAGTLLGVKYSPSTSVSHMTYSAPLISYAW